MIFPIVRGRLRGMFWRLDSGGKLLRVLGGTYEPEQTDLFARLVKTGDTVLDVGAHTGYYSLLAARLVGHTGSVWSFEPDPVNFGFLKRHIERNRLGQVHSIPSAVSDCAGTAHFERGTGTGTGRLGGEGQLRVDTVSIDEFCGARDLRVAAIKIDVEGAEDLVLRGALATLTRDGPAVFLSTHGSAVHAKCVELLRANGYTLRPIDGAELDSCSELLAVREAQGQSA